KSWRITRAGRNGTSTAAGAFASHFASPRTSFSVTTNPSRSRTAASRIVRSEYGSRSTFGTPADSSADSRWIRTGPEGVERVLRLPNGSRVGMGAAGEREGGGRGEESREPRTARVGSQGLADRGGGVRSAS